MSKASDAKAKFEKDFKSGKMKVNAGEIVSPGKLVAKLATKAAGKLASKSVVQAATGMTKQAAREKEIIAQMHASMPKAIAKATKTLNKGNVKLASSRNSVKAAETRAALKSAKSKPPLATPKSNVKVTKPVLNSGARNANEQGRIADMRYSADHARALAEKRVAALKLAKKSKVIKII